VIFNVSSGADVLRAILTQAIASSFTPRVCGSPKNMTMASSTYCHGALLGARADEAGPRGAPNAGEGDVKAYVKRNKNDAADAEAICEAAASPTMRSPH
jgi:hypothetical protein